MPATKKPQHKRCAIYTRVSTTEQAEGDFTSLDSQYEASKHYISSFETEGWQFYEHLHFEDRGVSGKTLNRPAMRSLRRAIKNGDVDIVVCFKIDRLSRQIAQFYEIWEEMKAHDVKFVSTSERFDTTTPSGVLMLNLLLSFGQYERELINERTRKGMQDRIKHGKHVLGNAPLGYTYDTNTKVLSIDPTERAIVTLAFNGTGDGKTPNTVANMLNKKGLQTKSRTNKNGKVSGGKPFTVQSIITMIHNPYYKGYTRTDDGKLWKAEWDGIVEVETWDKANHVLDSRKKAPKRLHLDRNIHSFLLKGLLRCGHCNNGMTPKPAGKLDKHGNPYRYYTCNFVSKHSASSSNCSMKNLNADKAEQTVLDALTYIGNSPALVHMLTKKHKDGATLRTTKISQRLEQVRYEKSVMKNTLDKIIDKIAGAQKGSAISEGINKKAETIKTRLISLENEKDALDSEKSYLNKSVDSGKNMIQVLESFEQSFKNAKPEAQARLVELFLRSMTVKKISEQQAAKIKPSLTVKSLQIRTSWYSVKLKLYDPSLFQDISEVPMPSSHSEKEWYPGWDSNPLPTD
jgi:site-specific DNA recombinase